MGIELEVDSIDIDTDEILEGLADEFAEGLSSGEMECPADDCDNDLFDVEIWTTGGGGLDGEAVCMECNSRIVLDLEDSGVKDALKEIEQTFENMF